MTVLACTPCTILLLKANGGPVPSVGIVPGNRLPIPGSYEVSPVHAILDGTGLCLGHFTAATEPEWRKE